jgi:PAS domain S-box-containing protein
MQDHTDESRLHAVVDTAVDGVILIDGHARVLMFNPARERLFGYPASEVIGQNVKFLMPPPYSREHDRYR